MRSKVFWMAVWLVLGATALAQRTYLEAGTTADMSFSFAQQTAFGLAATVDAGVRDLAGPFGVGGRFGIQVAQGGAAFELGLSGLFHLLAWKDMDGDREVSYSDYLGFYMDSNGNIQLVTPGQSGVNITMEVAYAYASVQGLPGSPPLGALPNLLPGTR
jgi:hypothetical protein